MNYRIIGADGKMYGPVGADEIRQWLAQGRADCRTLVYVEGAASWTPLGQLPEFARQVGAGAPPPIGAVTPGATPAGGTNNLATTALVFALLSWCCPCCCVPFNLLGLVLSIVALVRIKGRPGRGMAIAALVLSLLSLLFGVLGALLGVLLNPDTKWLDQF